MKIEIEIEEGTKEAELLLSQPDPGAFLMELVRKETAGGAEMKPSQTTVWNLLEQARQAPGVRRTPEQIKRDLEELRGEWDEREKFLEGLR